MANDNILSEEKVFNIIKDRREALVKIPSLLKKIQNRLLNLTRNYNFKKVDFKQINSFFSVILIVLGLAVVYSFDKRENINKVYEKMTKVKARPYEAKNIEPFKPLTDYQETIGGRNIFLPVKKGALGAGKSASLNLKEVIKDFVLAGIYQGGQQYEIMIEDKATQKTYFLKQGDEIKGVKVKNILRDRVIFEYQEEESELL